MLLSSPNMHAGIVLKVGCMSQIRKEAKDRIFGRYS